MEDHIYIGELILLQLFLGSFVYILGILTMILMTINTNYNTKVKFFLVTIQFIISFLLSLSIWSLGICKEKLDLFNIINLPALYAEFITLLFFLYKFNTEKK